MFRQYAQDSLRRKLAVYSRGGADLMAGSFDGTALVPGNMAGFRCDRRFMRTQKSGQHCQVYLCAAFQKMDIHILPANFLPEKISRMFAVLIVSIGCVLFGSRLSEGLQQFWMGTLAIIVLKTVLQSDSRLFYTNCVRIFPQKS